MMLMQIMPMLAVTALCGLLLAFRRVKRAAQPLRLLMAQRGETLLGDEISAPVRSHIQFMMATAFNSRLQLIYGIVAVPFIALAFIVAPQKVMQAANRLQISDPVLRAKFQEVCRLHDRITFANHPILMVLWEAEIVIFIPAALLIFTTLSGKLPERGNSESIKAALEMSEQDFISRLGWRTAEI